MQNVQKARAFLVVIFTLSAQFALARRQLPDAMRVKGAAAYHPVEIHVLSVGYHSVSGGATRKSGELQTAMFEQFTKALDAFSDAAHPIHSSFNDATAQKWLAESEGVEGVIRRRSASGCFIQYQKNLTYMRNVLSPFWRRFVTDSTIEESGLEIDDVKKKVLTMAWLKNRIDTSLTKEKRKEKDPVGGSGVIAIGSLLDSQEVEELDPAVGLHGVNDLEITLGLTSGDIIACGGTHANLKMINITTAEALFMGCSAALANEWQPPEWRAWWAHGPPAALRKQIDPSDASILVYPHMFVDASSTQLMKDEGTIQSRDSKKKNNKRKSSDGVDVQRDDHEWKGLLAMQLANKLVAKSAAGGTLSPVETAALHATLMNTTAFLGAGDHNDKVGDDTPRPPASEAEASSPTRTHVLAACQQAADDELILETD